MPGYLDPKWLRVNRHNPCPVCGKPDWCMISPDGRSAICARIESPHKAGNAGWLHQLDKALPVSLPPPVSTIVKASADALNSAYTTFLSLLTLSVAHRENLRSRGLSDLDINCLGYKSMPLENRGQIVARLISMGYNMAGIPGFYYDGKWRLAGPAGILIPVRDVTRRILGFQVRLDRAVKGKYRWISSVNYKGGCSPGAPVHVAYPSQYYTAGQDDRIWITEGALKADIASINLLNMVLAVAGVGNYISVIPIIQSIYPDPARARVILAYDMDKEKNHYVNSYLNELTERLLRLGFYTFHADWDPKKKGIDDLLCQKNLSLKSR